MQPLKTKPLVGSLMVEFLTTTDMVAKIEKIIQKAEKNLTLISPYIQLEQTLFERLKQTCDRGVNVRIVYGKDALANKEWSKIKELSHVDLYYYENLHAKCYFHDNWLVMGSLNLYEASEKNREMGIFLDKENASDAQAFKDAITEANGIILASEQKHSKNSSNSRIISKNGGYCIRCKTAISINPSHPLCSVCYSKWSKYSDETYPEKYCHQCGKEWETSMAKPLCKSCYHASN